MNLERISFQGAVEDAIAFDLMESGRKKRHTQLSIDSPMSTRADLDVEKAIMREEHERDARKNARKKGEMHKSAKRKRAISPRSEVNVQHEPTTPQVGPPSDIAEPSTSRAIEESEQPVSYPDRHGCGGWLHQYGVRGYTSGSQGGMMAGDVHDGMIASEMHSKMLAGNLHGEGMAGDMRGGQMFGNRHGARMASDSHGQMVYDDGHGGRMAGDMHGGRMPGDVHGGMLAGDVHGRMLAGDVHDGTVYNMHGGRTDGNMHGGRMPDDVHSGIAARDVYGRMVAGALHSGLVAGAVHDGIVAGDVHCSRMLADMHGRRMSGDAHVGRMSNDAHNERISGDAHIGRIFGDAHDGLIAGGANCGRMPGDVHGGRMAGEVHSGMVPGDAHDGRMALDVHGRPTGGELSVLQGSILREKLQAMHGILVRPEAVHHNAMRGGHITGVQRARFADDSSGLSRPLIVGNALGSRGLPSVMMRDHVHEMRGVPLDRTATELHVQNVGGDVHGSQGTGKPKGSGGRRRTYSCSVCGQPKKGHTCRPLADQRLFQPQQSSRQEPSAQMGVTPSTFRSPNVALHAPHLHSHSGREMARVYAWADTQRGEASHRNLRAHDLSAAGLRADQQRKSGRGLRSRTRLQREVPVNPTRS